MSTFSVIPEEQIEALAKVLGECGTGSEISNLFKMHGIEDNSGESTKWRRLNSVFLDIQRRDRCANRVINFIQSLLNPVRFIERVEEFEERRKELNVILAFSGMEYGKDGKFCSCNVAKTIDEAEKRMRTLQAKLQGRRVHHEVVKYCRTELLQDNYFHTVFEASKGLAQRIRDLSTLSTDGATLVDQVFSVERPVLAFNTLTTETEKSEHKGFAMLLKGCFVAVRNPLAHEPKLLWHGEDDAADYLSLISLLHRKLDDCVRTGLS